MRTFATGATRDSDETKIDYEGFLSPTALEAFGQYMTRHRKQTDGKLRASDNWQKGIPLDAYMKSLLRHVFAVWKKHRQGIRNTPELLEDLCGVFFNAQGYIHETLQADVHNPGPSLPEEFQLHSVPVSEAADSTDENICKRCGHHAAMHGSYAGCEAFIDNSWGQSICSCGDFQE